MVYQLVRFVAAGVDLLVGLRVHSSGSCSFNFSTPSPSCDCRCSFYGYGAPWCGLWCWLLQPIQSLGSHDGRDGDHASDGGAWELVSLLKTVGVFLHFVFFLFAQGSSCKMGLYCAF
jgi:hypothetical protein